MNASDQSLSGIPAPWQASTRSRRRGKGWLIPVSAVIFLLGGAGLWHLQTLPPPVVYDTAPVIRRDLENTVTASGHIEPKAYVDVGAQVSGQLHRLYVAAADQVEAGQLLAEIDAEVQAAQVEGLQAELAKLAAERKELQAQLGFAEQQADRRLSVLGRGSSLETLQEAERDRDILRARIEALDATIRRSRAELRAEEATLARSRITSPMTGTVVAVEAREGQTLNANYDTPVILRIADLGTMTVRSDVSEADVVHLRPGMSVWFTTLGFPDRRYRSRLRQVLPAPPVNEGEGKTSLAVTYIAMFDVTNTGGELVECR
jgi:macrolide-specific efflux system membrane fusion protein